MLSCSALAGLSFMLNFIFEFGMTRETWLLVLSSSKVLGDFLLFEQLYLSQIESVDNCHEVHM